MWKEAYTQGKENLQLPSIVETRHAFQIFAPRASSRRFCFFIDGLDEYDGDYRQAIALIQSLSGHSNVKVIGSSRPITPCYNAFHKHPSLQLQALNRRDIETYVTEHISAHIRINASIQIHSGQIEEIYLSLVANSQGVFLWVVLACRAILDNFCGWQYCCRTTQSC